MLNFRHAIFFEVNSKKLKEMHFLKTFLFTCFILFCAGAFAQKTSSAKIQYYKKFKAPKLSTSLGNYRDTVFVSTQVADSLLGMSLKISDAKNNVYTISSFYFLYRKIVATEDEQTGKVSNTTSVKSSLFKSSPLPQLWQNAVRENLRPGEELLFFDVIAKDLQGHVMYAPNLKFILR